MADISESIQGLRALLIQKEIKLAHHRTGPEAGLRALLIQKEIKLFFVQLNNIHV